MDNLLSSLKIFGLNSDEIVIYLYLLENGKETALEISRQTDIPRTRVYRTLDKLIAKGLVSFHKKSKGGIYIPASPKHFELLLKKKEYEVEAMREAVAYIKQFLYEDDVEQREISKGEGLTQLKIVLGEIFKKTSSVSIYNPGLLHDLLGSEAFSGLKKAAKVEMIGSKESRKKFQNIGRVEVIFFEKEMNEQGFAAIFTEENGVVVNLSVGDAVSFIKIQEEGMLKFLKGVYDLSVG